MKTCIEHVIDMSLDVTLCITLFVHNVSPPALRNAELIRYKQIPRVGLVW